MHYSLRIALLVLTVGAALFACGGELRRSSCDDNQTLHDGDCIPNEQVGGKGGSGGGGASAGGGRGGTGAGGEPSGGAAGDDGGAGGLAGADGNVTERTYGRPGSP